MSLLRLLTAGKSLVGLKDNGTHYSLAQRALLPKFGSKKNPFRASTRPEPAALPSKELPSAPSLSEGTVADPGKNDNSSTLSTPPVEGLSSPTPPESSQRVKAPAAEDARKRPLSRWTALMPWMRPRTPPTAIPRFSKTMVQGELSLEGVKVVRNDLSDSDLEIVRPKPGSVAPEMKPAQDETTKAEESSWERLTGRFLGAGKT